MLLTPLYSFTPRVSFIVPVYNARETVIETLESILALKTDGALEILVVDDGSTDGSPEVVEDWLAGPKSLPDRVSLRILRISHGGEAAAINAGLEQAAAPFIVWVESDVRLHPDWLIPLLIELEDPAVAGAGGVLYPSPNDPPVARMFGYEIAHKIRSNHAEVIHITSANALYRREIFEQLGPCRVELGESSFDSEYNQRIREAGYRLVCNQRARAWHHYKGSLLECLRRAAWYGFRRPMVKTQVLYPFDRLIGLLVASSMLLVPASALWWISPVFPLGLIVFVLAAHVGYSIYLYTRYRDCALLAAGPVFLLRNVVFGGAYLAGWIDRLLGMKRNRP
ncbi:MAG: glycosyltransferase family 2 protein [bacterium]